MNQKRKDKEEVYRKNENKWEMRRQGKERGREIFEAERYLRGKGKTAIPKEIKR